MTANSDIARRLMGLHRRTAELNPRVTVTDIAGGFVEEGDADSEYPSTNDNRASFIGCGGQITAQEFQDVVERFSERDLPYWFFWLSPCEQENDLRTWLADAGLKRFEGTGYPTLLREGGKLQEHGTDLEIRQVSERDMERCSDGLRDVYGNFLHHYTSTCGIEGYCHYLAFDGEAPVAGALMGTHEGTAGLGMAGTMESHRGRGAQNALITRRVNDALGLGCDLIVSETLYMLTTSLGNLRKKGFEVVYDKEVYVGGTNSDTIRD